MWRLNQLKFSGSVPVLASEWGRLVGDPGKPSDGDDRNDLSLLITVKVKRLEIVFLGNSVKALQARNCSVYGKNVLLRSS